jgi:hypothetical protein
VTRDHLDISPGCAVRSRGLIRNRGCAASGCRRLDERDDIKKNIAAMGARADYGTPRQFSDFVQAETVKFAAIIVKEGLQMEVK